MKRLEIEKAKINFRKLLEKEEYWFKTTEEGKEKILEYMTDEFSNEWDELKQLSREYKSWIANSSLALIIIIISITANLVSNIIHARFERFGLWYVLVVLVLLFLSIWLFITYVKSVNPQSDNKFYKHLVIKAREINQARKGK